MKNNVLKLMIGTIIVEVVLVCILILVGEMDSVGMNAIGSGLIILEVLIPCSMCAKIYDRNEYKYIGIAAMVIAFIIVVLATLGIWEIIFEEKDVENIVGALHSILWYLGFTSIILSYPKDNKVLNRFKIATIIIMGLLSLFITVLFIKEDFPDGFLARLFFVLIILSIGSYASTYILSKIKKDNNENTKVVNEVKYAEVNDENKK